MKNLLLVFLLAGLSAKSAAAEDLPLVTPDLAHVAAVSCVKIDDSGAVSGAFLITSTGDGEKDHHLLEWIKQLHWDKVKPGEKWRNKWFPMPISIGGETSPVPPEKCFPIASRANTK
jgi:hypothetical protein